MTWQIIAQQRWDNLVVTNDSSLLPGHGGNMAEMSRTDTSNS